MLQMEENLESSCWEFHDGCLNFSSASKVHWMDWVGSGNPWDVGHVESSVKSCQIEGIIRKELRDALYTYKVPQRDLKEQPILSIFRYFGMFNAGIAKKGASHSNHDFGVLPGPAW